MQSNVVAPARDPQVPVLVKGLSQGIASPGRPADDASSTNHPMLARAISSPSASAPQRLTHISSSRKRITAIERLRNIIHAYADKHILELVDKEDMPKQLMLALMDKISNQRDTETIASFNYFGPQRLLIWGALSSNGTDWFASVLKWFFISLTILSITSICAQTIPTMAKWPYWYMIENVVSVVFLLELLMRAVSCRDLKKDFWGSRMNQLDMLTLFPSLVDAIFFTLGWDTSKMAYTVLSALRVLRIFKIGRYLSWVPMIIDVFTSSYLPLLMMLFIFCLVLIGLSTSIYFAEHDAGPNSKFVSIPVAMYWCVITLATIGYGDIVPVTLMGKLIASITALWGILLLAIPISIVSERFQEMYMRRNDVCCFVERYRAKQQLEIQGRVATQKDRLQWLTHSVLEVTTFNLISRISRSLQVQDMQIDDEISDFFHDIFQSRETRAS